MARKRKYDIGKLINGEWVIVSILQTKKQNSEVLCYHLDTKKFVEGWIWDFTRGLVNPLKKHRKKTCELIEIVPSLNLEMAQNTNIDCAWKLVKKSTYLSDEDRYVLESIRNGYLGNVTDILKKFNEFLNISGHSRRNNNLARVISSTYYILQERKYFK